MYRINKQVGQCVRRNPERATEEQLWIMGAYNRGPCSVERAVAGALGSWGLTPGGIHQASKLRDQHVEGPSGAEVGCSRKQRAARTSGHRDRERVEGGKTREAAGGQITGALWVAVKGWILFWAQIGALGCYGRQHRFACGGLLLAMTRATHLVQWKQKSALLPASFPFDFSPPRNAFREQLETEGPRDSPWALGSPAGSQHCLQADARCGEGLSSWV